MSNLDKIAASTSRAEK